MAITIQRTKADDPNELRKRIAQLEAELRKKTSAAAGPRALARARQEGEWATERRLEAELVAFEKAIAQALKSLRVVNGSGKPALRENQDRNSARSRLAYES